MKKVLVVDDELDICRLLKFNLEKEAKLLVFLASNPGKIYNREQLLDRVWGDDVYVTPRTVDVYIRKLREKIEKNPDKPEVIKTRRGIGYYFEQG